jgi:hypothetical protein
MSSGSIPSTAAVARGAGSRESERGRADFVVNVKKHGKRKAADDATKERISLESDFELDYEEVFLSSNVPQLIATPAGRIVICK